MYTRYPSTMVVWIYHGLAPGAVVGVRQPWLLVPNRGQFPLYSKLI